MTRQWEVAWGRRTWPNRPSSELGVAATALAGVAWLTLVLGLRWQLRTKAGHASRHRVHHSRRHHHQRDPDRDHDPTETTERCRR
jgi:hypothetical protein